jgi:hypothetical protein
MQVEETRCALNISQCLNRRILKPLVHLAAGERPAELPTELIQVMFHHPVQIHQIAIHIVQHFDLGLILQKVQRRSTSEWLNVAGMLREHRQDVLGQTALAADPRDDGCVI